MNVKDIKGLPQIDLIKSNGYVLYKQTDGFHLHWKAKGKKAVKFEGKITCESKRKIMKKKIMEYVRQH